MFMFAHHACMHAFKVAVPRPDWYLEAPVAHRLRDYLLLR